MRYMIYDKNKKIDLELKTHKNGNIGINIIDSNLDTKLYMEVDFESLEEVFYYLHMEAQNEKK